MSSGTTTPKSGSTDPSFTDVFLASIITGSTVVIMHGIMEALFGFGLDTSGSRLMKLLMNILVSAASGFVAISLVNATGLLQGS